MKWHIWQDFRAKAALVPQRLILADGNDERAVRAAVQARKEGLAHPTLIGSRARIESQWTALSGIGIPLCVDADTFSPEEEAEWLTELRAIAKFRNLSVEEAKALIKNPLILGCLYVKKGRADGFIGGAVASTADTLRAVISVIGLAPKTPILFGFFLLENNQATSEENSLVLMADCAVIPEPSPKQLAAIAVRAATAFELFTGRTPRVAFLSFSTAGSALHPMVDKIREACELAKKNAPALALDGEWQADAALDQPSAQVKGVGRSPIAGRANVLIAPDLNTGNIAYKLVQRLGGCRAVGPVLWGTALPANDLSRGCSTEDILDMMALTSMQARFGTPGRPIQGRSGDRYGCS